MSPSRPHRRAPTAVSTLAGLAVVISMLAGCALKTHNDPVNGKRLFVARCGSCHELAHANTKGIPGPPNLDAAFGPARQSGFNANTIQGIVYSQILNPNQQVQNDATGTYRMPANLAKGQDARDIAAYVGLVAGVPGQDSGLLATAVLSATRKPAAEQNGKLEIDADPTGQLQYLAPSAAAKAGPVTITMKNASSIQHDIAIQGTGANATSQIVANGASASVSVTLKPGSYTFYCSVPGHRQAGMQGTLTVK
ncbi:MAG: plastocyanin/azurin family copper-binding protein [Solirubrobacteraceae bacterium]|nr:MAG: hypothetical protein DLM63_02110 [Solirubrobacterales bacterium]